MADAGNKMDAAGSLIEDVRDYLRRKKQGDMARCLLLEKFWPVPGDKSAAMSGIVCFVALFRFIYCRLDLETRDEMDDTIRQNGLLRFAVSNFGREGDGAKEREACKLMHAALTEQLGCQPTFDNLAESDLVLKSMWAFDWFRLYYPILWRSGPESPLCDFLPEERRDLVEARMGLIVWNTSEHRSILEAIMAHEGMFRGRLEGLDKDQVEFALAFRSPLVMRVKVSAGDRVGCFDMSNISELRVPITTYSDQADLGEGATKGIRTMTFSKQAGSSSYRLLAIVKLRAEEDERDDVRFFGMRGNLIRPQSGRPGLETFCSLEWSIQDQRRPLMLYYVRIPTASPQYAPITDEFGGEKIRAASADTSEPRSDTLAPETPPGALGTSRGAGDEQPASSGAGASNDPAQSPGSASTLDSDEASSRTLSPM